MNEFLLFLKQSSLQFFQVNVEKKVYKFQSFESIIKNEMKLVLIKNFKFIHFQKELKYKKLKIKI